MPFTFGHHAFDTARRELLRGGASACVQPHHATCVEVRTRQLARRHVLPHLLPLLLSQFLIYVPACLIAEANLGTMGLGISEPLPSWGSMLLSLSSTATLAGSHWVYLPIILLVTILFLLEMLVFEV